MLDILKQKLLGWTPAEADRFFNNMPRFGIASNRIWETAPTGYFLYDSTFCGYFDYNGKSYILEIDDLVDEYTKKQRLASASIPNKIAVEMPTTIELVDLYGVVYTYVEQTRPYNSMGISALNLALTGNKEDVLDFIKTVYKTQEQFLNLMNTLEADSAETVYPETFDIFKQVYFDPGTQNYFLIGRFPNHITKGDYYSIQGPTYVDISEVSEVVSKVFNMPIDASTIFQELEQLCPTFLQA
jgi:hypothetical protein